MLSDADVEEKLYNKVGLMQALYMQSLVLALISFMLSHTFHSVTRPHNSRRRPISDVVVPTAPNQKFDSNDCSHAALCCIQSVSVHHLLNPARTYLTTGTAAQVRTTGKIAS